MGYGKYVYETVLAQLSRRRFLAENQAKKRRKAFFLKYPQAEVLQRKIARTSVMACKAVLNGSNVQLELNKLKQKNLSWQQQLNDIIIKAGYDSDYLQVHYHCKLCNDKGNIDGKQCTCMRQLLRQEAYKRLNSISSIKLLLFEDFNLDYYSAIPIKDSYPAPKKRMTDIFHYCKNYADTFSISAKSLLLQGGTGLGKTHLSLAIAKTVIDKGYGVIYTSAPSILNQLEKEKFQRKKDDYDENSELHLIKCDLLIIDDLGSEFLTNFSGATIYNIINSRIMYNRPTIISTNFSMKELEKSYSARLVSRMMGSYVKLTFLGSDVRQIMNKV